MAIVKMIIPLLLQGDGTHKILKMLGKVFPFFKKPKHFYTVPNSNQKHKVIISEYLCVHLCVSVVIIFLPKYKHQGTICNIWSTSLLGSFETHLVQFT